MRPLSQWLVLPYLQWAVTGIKPGGGRSKDPMGWDGLARALDVLAEIPGDNGLGLRVDVGEGIKKVAVSSMHVRAWTMAKDRGLRTSVEAWTGRTNAADEADVDHQLGIDQGAALGEVCYLNDVDVAATNSEYAAQRGPKVKWFGRIRRILAPGADEFLAGLAEGVRLAAPAERMELGFKDRDNYYLKAKPSPAWADYDSFGIMAYQSSERGIRDKIETAIENVQVIVPGARPDAFAWYAPVGRVNAAGLVVGSEKAILSIAADPKPLVGSIRYYAAGGPDWGLARAGWRQVLSGHRRHRALIELWPEVAKLSGG